MSVTQSPPPHTLLPLRPQVAETVRIFVTDANDEQPEFQNLPFAIDVPEVKMKER